jgi:hypothetical protein
MKMVSAALRLDFRDANPGRGIDRDGESIGPEGVIAQVRVFVGEFAAYTAIRPLINFF